MAIQRIPDWSSSDIGQIYCRDRLKEMFEDYGITLDDISISDTNSDTPYWKKLLLSRNVDMVYQTNQSSVTIQYTIKHTRRIDIVSLANINFSNIKVDYISTAGATPTNLVDLTNNDQKNRYFCHKLPITPYAIIVELGGKWIGQNRLQVGRICLLESICMFKSMSKFDEYGITAIDSSKIFSNKLVDGSTSQVSTYRNGLDFDLNLLPTNDKLEGFENIMSYGQNGYFVYMYNASGGQSDESLGGWSFDNIDNYVVAKGSLFRNFYKGNYSNGKMFKVKLIRTTSFYVE